MTTKVRVIAGRGETELRPRLLGLLTLADPESLRCELWQGAGGEICLRPTRGRGRVFDPGAPRHWVEAEIGEDRVVTADGLSFAVTRRRAGIGPLEIAILAARSAVAPVAAWRREVVLALPDQAAMGRVVRRLLAWQRERISYWRAPPPQDGAAGQAPAAIDPALPFVLLVRDCPLLVLLEVVDEGLGNVFYGLPEPPDGVRPVYLPWGMEFPLLRRIVMRSHDDPYVITSEGRIVPLPLEHFDDIYTAIAPSLDAVSVVGDAFAPGEVRIDVPVRLSPLGGADFSSPPPALWRMGRRGIEQLTADLYCPESELSSLEAMAIRPPGGGAPELFLLDAAGRARSGPLPVHDEPDVRCFCRGQGLLRTLFLPRGQGLLPPLADDTVRELVGLRPDELTIVDRVEGGGLQLTRLERGGFESVRGALVQYALAHHEEPVQRLLTAVRFDFDEPIPLDEAALAASAADASESPGSGPGEGSSRARAAIPTRRPRRAPKDQQAAARRSRQVDRAKRSAVVSGVSAASAQTAAGGGVPSLSTLAERVLAASSGVGAAGWADYGRAARQEQRPTDASVALVLRLLTRTPERAAIAAELSLHLGVEPAPEALLQRLVAPLPATSAPADTHRLEPDLFNPVAERVFCLYLLAATAPERATDGPVRRAVTELAEPVQRVGFPALSWLYARAAHEVLADRTLLESLRHHLQQCFVRLLPLEVCVPPAVVEALHGRLVADNQRGVTQFVERFAFAAPAELWFRVLLALRSLDVSGGSLDRSIMASLYERYGAARAELGPSGATHAEEFLRYLDRVRGCERSHPAACGWATHLADPHNRRCPVRAYLIAEGVMPGSQRGGVAEAAAAFDDLLCTADEALVAKLDDCWQRYASQYDTLGVLVPLAGRLALRGQHHALTRLDELLATQAERLAASADPESRRRGLLTRMAQLSAVAGQAAVDEVAQRATDIVAAIRREVDAGHLLPPDWQDLTLRLLSVLAERASADRTQLVLAVFEALRNSGAIPEWDASQPVTTRGRRVLARLVRLLVADPRHGVEAERLRHEHWSRLRSIVAEEYPVAADGGSIL